MSVGQGYSGVFHHTRGDENEFTSNRSIEENALDMRKKFPLTQGGYFGRRGNGRIRIIECDNPLQTSSDFFYTLGKGGKFTEFSNAKGHIIQRLILSDNTVIIYRQITSSEGSPAVEITVNPPHTIKTQKIHFVRKATLW